MIDGSKTPIPSYAAKAEGTGWDLLHAVREIIWTTTNGYQCTGMHASHKTMYDLTMETTPMAVDHVNQQLGKGVCHLYGFEVMLTHILPDNVIEVFMELSNQRPVIATDEPSVQWEDDDE